MTLELPNFGEAGSAPEQSRLYATDLAILSLVGSLTGVKDGCAVTAQGSPDMTLAVASGTVYWLNAEVVVTAGNVTITAANATNPRLDLVVVNSSGVKSVVAGTPAAIPAEPALPALSVALAQVFVPAAVSAIAQVRIRDRRITVQIPSVQGASTIVRKTADESVTSQTTLQDDNHLFFNMTSNGRWAVKFVLMLTQPLSNNSMLVNWSFPAGTKMRFAYGGTSWVTNDLGAPSDISIFISQQPLIAVIEGVVSTVATSGDLRLRWAQNFSSVNAMTMLTNSFLEYRPLP